MFESPTSITITTESGIRMVDVMTDANTDVPLEADPDGVTYRTGPLDHRRAALRARAG